MKRHRFRWIATVVPLIAIIILIANSSSSQVQEGTGHAKRTTGLVTWPD